MESSATTSLNMKTQAIITKYLTQLSAGKWKRFKTALCNNKPAGEAEEITMENLHGKKKEQVVELIFKCYNKKHGTEIILNILKDLKEPKMRRNMQSALAKASKKNCDKLATPNDATVSSSQPPAKKTRQQDGEVPGPSHNTEQNADTMGGPSPAQEQPKQGTSQSNPKNVNKKGGSSPAKKKKKRGPSQSRNMEKEIKKIMTKHLEKLGKEDKLKFEKVLCAIDTPFIGKKIEEKDIKGKSVKIMVDLIISHHTRRHAQATVEKVLDQMGKTEIKMLIVEEIRDVSSTNTYTNHQCCHFSLP